jgi:hypothetical protein
VERIYSTLHIEKHNKEMNIMAKPIEIGTVLTGQDAIDFINYMHNPTYTDRALKMMAKIIRDDEEQNK